MIGSGFKIQMKDGGQWFSLGGSYDGATASERVSQFMNHFSGKNGAREFRIVAQESDSRDGAKRFPTERTSRSPQIGARRRASGSGRL